MGRLLALARSAPAAMAVLVGVAAVWGASRGGFTDLFVYRYAGQHVLDGLSVYGSRDPVMGLPFTYPPFAAVLMVPLAVLPTWAAAALLTGASAAALAAAVHVVRRAQGRPTDGWLVVALCAAALALEPVWQNVVFGQLNLLLMLAVLVDVLRPERRLSGVLVGIAAGVKLTPLVFVVLLVLIGRRASAARAALAFAATVAVGFAAMPGPAASYWTHGLLDPTRIGPPALAHNQSIDGALTRLLGGPPPTAVWLAVAGPLALGVLWTAARWWRRDRVLGTGLAALAMLLASPMSWSHHWVWAVPVALALWERSRWAAAAWVAVFVARPMLWPPWGDGREYAWSPIEHVVGNAYVVAALVVCAWAAVYSSPVRLKARSRRPLSQVPPTTTTTAATTAYTTERPPTRDSPASSSTISPDQRVMLSQRTPSSSPPSSPSQISR
ncbi:alpha-1,2-mannosyltransferase [Nocardioides soli]|uniref:Alpha-1,2-mannosyltransferase n=1 Tax=Nocardioides soli TaxID=1036020 RepID=A0A7W4W0D4_9ACTN|nr:alpha-1,2-mannosyltransferase [Nocardioides soli]